MPGDDALPGVRKGREEIGSLDPVAGEGGGDAVAERAEPGIVGQKEQATSDLQHGDRGPRSQRDRVTIGFGERELPFLAEPGRREILNG
jgi:hypothetical protein